MSIIRLFCFGFPRIITDEQPSQVERRKALALAVYLSTADRPQSRDHLATLLWPDLDQEHARAALRSTLPTLTTLSATPWLLVDRGAIALSRTATWVDVREFLALLGDTRVHAHPPDAVCCAECQARRERAITLYQGAFLMGFTLPGSSEFDDWQAGQRAWLQREFAGALRLAAEYEGEQERYEVALMYARRWLALDTLHEPAHRLVMRLAALSGQRSEALRHYQQCAELLDAELATPPEPATTALYNAIKAGNIAHAGERPQITRSLGVAPPAPGLLVGRAGALRDIKRRVGVGGVQHPVTVIQGWPGVGKSTVVAALAHDQDIANAFVDGVLWASLGETPSLLTHALTWAAALGLSFPNRTPSLEEITAHLTAALREKRMLLIVDDVWQEEHATPFKIGGRACATVLTSRLNEVAQALAPIPQDVYRLPVLDDAPAIELLAALAPEVVAAHPGEARELALDLEGLPLAIQVAGRLLQSEARLGWGVRDLLNDLRRGAALLAATAPSDMVGAACDTTPSIAALLKRSTDSLAAETRSRFALLGLFAPKPATFDLQAMGVAWEVADSKPTARVLVNRGLLEPVSNGRFQMHALLKLHACSLLEEV